MARFQSLTPEQRARIPEFRDKWMRIALCTEPIDLARATAAIRSIYRLGRLSSPKIIPLPCPLTAALAAISYAAHCQAGSLNRHNPDRSVCSLIERATQGELNKAAVVQVKASVDMAANLALDSGFFSAGALVKGSLRRAAEAATYGQADRAAGSYPLFARGMRDVFAANSAAHFARFPPVGPLIVAAVDALSVPANMEMIEMPGRGDIELCQFSRWRSDWAWADFVSQVFGVPADPSLLELAASCSDCWMLNGLCFVAERPRAIHHDEQGRLHCETGPSIRYASGWEFWHWHGTRVPESLIRKPESLSVAQIENEKNVAVRRVMIERYGTARFLSRSGATLIQQDARGKLWRKELSGDEPVVMVQVRNHTAEPDGTFKDYFLRVPAHIRTAAEAVAWSFAVPVQHYRPRTET